MDREAVAAFPGGVAGFAWATATGLAGFATGFFGAGLAAAFAGVFFAAGLRAAAVFAGEAAFVAGFDFAAGAEAFLAGAGFGRAGALAFVRGAGLVVFFAILDLSVLAAYCGSPARRSARKPVASAARSLQPMRQHVAGRHVRRTCL